MDTPPPANEVRLRAVLVEKNELRYTPAGIAVFEARFHHCGQQFEAAAVRKVEFDFMAVSFADTAIRLQAVAQGSEIEMKGFLAARSQRNSKLTLHVTEFKE